MLNQKAVLYNTSYSIGVVHGATGTRYVCDSLFGIPSRRSFARCSASHHSRRACPRPLASGNGGGGSPRAAPSPLDSCICSVPRLVLSLCCPPDLPVLRKLAPMCPLRRAPRHAPPWRRGRLNNLTRARRFGVAAGLNDRVARTKMTTAARFPVGSVTKPYTVAAVMQLHEQGAATSTLFGPFRTQFQALHHPRTCHAL